RLAVVSHLYGALRHLHSFPTRRSSDLFEDGILDRRPLQLEVLGPNGAFEPVYDDIVEMEPDGRFRMTMLEPTSSALRMTVCSGLDRKSTRLNSSHVKISYAVFCLKKKN